MRVRTDEDNRWQEVAMFGERFHQSAPSLIYSAPEADAVVGLGIFRLGRADARAFQPEWTIGGHAGLAIGPTWSAP
jgi:hypothetical protein